MKIHITKLITNSLNKKMHQWNLALAHDNDLFYVYTILNMISN